MRSPDRDGVVYVPVITRDRPEEALAILLGFEGVADPIPLLAEEDL